MAEEEVREIAEVVEQIETSRGWFYRVRFEDGTEAILSEEELEAAE